MSFNPTTQTYQNTPQDVTGLRNNLSQWLQGMGPTGYNGQTTTPNYTPQNSPQGGYRQPGTGITPPRIAPTSPSYSSGQNAPITQMFSMGTPPAGGGGNGGAPAMNAPMAPQNRLGYAGYGTSSFDPMQGKGPGSPPPPPQQPSFGAGGFQPGSPAPMGNRPSFNSLPMNPQVPMTDPAQSAVNNPAQVTSGGYTQGTQPSNGGKPTPDPTRVAQPTGPMAPIGTASQAFSQIFAQPAQSYTPVQIGTGQAAQSNLNPMTGGILNSILGMTSSNSQQPQTISDLLNPTSSFSTSVLPALQAGFTAQRTQDLAQAKESAGNLTGSGLADTIANQTNKSLGTEQSTIGQTLAQLAGTQSGQNVNVAGINSAAQTAGANTQANTLAQLLGLTQSNTSATNAQNLAQAGLNQTQLQSIFQNANSMNSQNANNFLALLNSMSGTGVSSPTTVQTPGAGQAITGGILSMLPYLIGG